MTPPQFIGLQNYVQIFTQDDTFSQSLKVTGLYTVFSVPLHIVLGLVLASLLNTKVLGKTVFRAIFYPPAILPIVATAVVFNPQFGLINLGLAVIGIKGPGWLTSEQWALPAIVIMNVQYIGFTMVLLLAALQRVPQELIESAQLDGANPFLFYMLNLYNNAFRYFKMGYGSALAWILFIGSC